jgi:uncharacterized protein YciI
MAEWLYFLPAPRENFAATMTDQEREVWGRHLDRLKQLFADGVIVLVGPTLGKHNTGVCIFEAPDEAAAQAIVAADPCVAEGYAKAELRPYRITLLRGRD